jgi:predicted nucleotidyltransferase
MFALAQPREPKESFYLETKNGWFFAVKGLEHPPDRWIAVLRYVPDPERGDRKKKNIRYRRLYHFDEQAQLIREAQPQYMAFDTMLQTTLQSVPKSLVRRVYDPGRKLEELFRSGAESKIEEDAGAFAGLLQREASVRAPSLGITGSLLIGLHTEHSDLDMVVFGTHPCKRVYRALRRLLDGSWNPDLRRLNAGEIQDLYASRAADACMSFNDFAGMEKRKVNQGSFRDRTYFIRFVKELHEAGGSYGDLQYAPLKRAKITARIADDQESIFTPCRYLISDVCNADNSPLPNVNEIVSFRGRFCEQARVGEFVVAAGTLERVQDHRGDAWHRLLLGNSREDTMVVRR